MADVVPFNSQVVRDTQGDPVGVNATGNAIIGHKGRGTPTAPDPGIVGQLPISIYSGWDKVQDVLALLQQHDLGMFRSSSMFVDAMWRDDRIKGVLSARVGSLMATPLEHKAANRTKKAMKCRDLVAGSDDEAGIWDLIFPTSVMRSMTGWGITMDIVVGELIWVKHPRLKVGRWPMWVPRVRTWHPQFVYWDWNTFSYVLTTREGLVWLPKVDEGVYSDGKWFVYSQNGYQYGWLRAGVRSLAMMYIARGWGNRDWSRHSEVQGMGIRKAIMPASADEQSKDQFYQDVVNAGSEMVVGCERPDVGGDTGFDVKYEEAKARTWECFKDLLNAKNTDIAIDILGQNLTTEVQGGSRAAAQVQDQVRIDIRKCDATIAQAFRNQVISWWAYFNFEDPELAPKTSFQVDPPADELARASGWKMVGDAIASLKNASDAVDDVAMLDEAGIPLKTPEQIEAERAEKQAQAQEAFERQQQLAAAQGPKQPPPGGGAPQTRGQNKNTPPFGNGKPADGKESADGAAQLKLGAHPQPGPVQRRVFQELPIAIENPAGTMRHWYEPGSATPRGSVKMLHDYGYIEGHTGSDGEELDVYLGPDESARNVHIVHQLAQKTRINEDGTTHPVYSGHDEDKVMLGFPTADDARAAFAAHRNDGEQAIGGMSVIPTERFKAKLKRRTGHGKITASAVAPADDVDFVDDPNADPLDDEALPEPVINEVPTPDYDHLRARTAAHYSRVAGTSSLAALIIKRERGGFSVYSEDGAKRLGGPYKTRGEAEKRLEQVDYFKSKKTSALATRVREAHARRLELGALTVLAGPKGGARYADRLEGNAKQLASGAMAPDVRALRKAVEDASSYDDLRDRVARIYRDMKPEKLAEVVQKAITMARLYGHVEASESVK